MGIIDADRNKSKSNLFEKKRLNARQYADKLSSALEMLREFDSKDVDDIYDVKASFEKTGRACILLTTHEGYMCLLDENGKLLASSFK